MPKTSEPPKYLFEIEELEAMGFIFDDLGRPYIEIVIPPSHDRDER